MASELAKSGNMNYNMAGSYMMASAGTSLLQAGVGLMSANNQKRMAKLQASAIKLNALQRSNALLEQFNSAVGNVTFGATRRGVKSNQGSVAQNIESSAIELGKDMKTMRSNASMKASATRTSGNIKANATRMGAISQGMSGLLGMQMGNQIRTTKIEEGLY